MHRICILTILWITGYGVEVLPASSNYKVESIGACSEAEVPEAVRSILQSEGIRVSGESGPLVEIWIRNVIPQRAGSSGAEYGTLASGTFIGIIHYRSKGGDYRGQAIKPGVYTLRYQTIPSDGNHLGVSPLPDFFLLTSAATDSDPNRVVEYQDLILLGKKAAGTNHPHPLNLTYPENAGKPGFHENEELNWFLEFKARAKPAGSDQEVAFPIALILIGKAEG